MRRLQFHMGKRAVKVTSGEIVKRTGKGIVKGTAGSAGRTAARTAASGSAGRTAGKMAAGAALAVLMALQITGCSQAGGGQEKTVQEKTAQEKTAQAAETGSAEAVTAGKQAEGGADAGKVQNAKAAGGASGQDSSKAGAAGEGDAGIEFKPGMPIKEGIAAPDFTAELVDGTSLTLSDLQGKPVIINFWATWCPPCVKEMPAFERLKTDFGDEIGIIAVNCGDDADTVKDFVTENGYTFPVALDEEYEISMLYPTSSIPYTVVLDGDGKVTHISAGAADADTMYERYKEALGV